MREVHAFAPGKLILAGEHAVVYGYRAVALAVSLGTTVRLCERPGPSAVDASEIKDSRLWPALSTVVPKEGVGVHIASTLPVGCGMGSSAALAVATVRAVARWEGREASFEECFEKAFVIERVFHGTPSGIDHTVSALGGVVVYRRGAGGPELEQLTLSRPLFLVVVDTGPPEKSTAEMVAGVRERAPTEELSAIGALVEQVVVVLKAGGEVGPLLDQNHRLLQKIGVSTPVLDDAVAQLWQAGASGAKLAGAGGGGVVFGLLTEVQQQPVVEGLLRDGFRAWAVQAG